jgi:hypothetical protein
MELTEAMLETNWCRWVLSRVSPQPDPPRLEALRFVTSLGPGDRHEFSPLASCRTPMTCALRTPSSGCRIGLSHEPLHFLALSPARSLLRQLYARSQA